MTDNKPGLTEGQLNVLETFHRRNLRFLLYQLDDGFYLQPMPGAPWQNLGYYLCELLKASDPKAFDLVRQGVLHSMLKGEELANPYTAAAIAVNDFTNNKIFRQVLEMLRKNTNKQGQVEFGVEILGRGEAYATLWALHVIHLADRAKDHVSVVEPALEYLEKNQDQVIEDSPVMTARLMSTMLRMNPEQGKALAQKCFDSLMNRRTENNRWDESPLGLGKDGEIVECLIEAMPHLGTQAGTVVEEWLDQVFDLSSSEEMPEFPKVFMDCKGGDRPDLFLEAWLKATLAAARYLRIYRPNNNAGAYIVGLSVPQENMLVRAEEMITLTNPYLPPLEEVQKRAGHLKTFWDAGTEPYEKNVYIMYDNAFPSNKRLALVKAVEEALWKYGLVGRHVTEGAVPYITDLWENAGLFMTGCKYGVALFDRLPDNEGQIPPEGPPAPELMYQIGFMKGQGMELLLLWDKKTKNGDTLPGVGVPMQKITPKSFDSSEEELAELRKNVEEWAQSLTGKEQNEV